MKNVEDIYNCISKRSGLKEALDDVRKGNVIEYSSSEEMFEKLGI